MRVYCTAHCAGAASLTPALLQTDRSNCEGLPGDWDLAALVEQRGYDGAWPPEINHDPFLLLALALALDAASRRHSVIERRYPG